MTEQQREVSENDVPYQKQECEERLCFEMFLADLSVRFIGVSALEVDAQIEDAQRSVCELLGLDLCAIWQWEIDNPEAMVLSHLYRGVDGPPVPRRMEASEYHPWSLKQVLAGKVVAISDMDNAPTEAARDMEIWRHYGIKTTLNIPLAEGGGLPFGAVSFNDIRSERTWSEPLIKRLQLIARVFANAIVRNRAELALRESEARLALAVDSADAGIWVLHCDTSEFWATDKARQIFGYVPDEPITLERFETSVHAEDLAEVQRAVERSLCQGDALDIDYRIRTGDGVEKWIVSHGKPYFKSNGEPERLVGISVDITKRKELEEQLRTSLVQVQELRDRLEDENIYLRSQILAESGHGIIIGESEAVKRMLFAARKVASTESNVLITGETGTGKELLAQAIHDMSSRKAKAMVKVNCAALPAPLIESELFGREKGAYTGAMTQQAGRFEVANGSTLFLDEIGDLPLDLQTKLLRVLQDGRFERLGSHRTLKTDARVIAATNRNLSVMVTEGTFREDLFHRLNVFPIDVPSLRTRTPDIPLLVWKIVQEFNAKMGRSIDSISKQTMEQFKQYAWPGNIRELRNVIERAMIMSEGRSLQIEFPEVGSDATFQPTTLEAVERKHILDVLEHTHWRVSGKAGAAGILGLKPTTLHSRMKKLGISRD